MWLCGRVIHCLEETQLATQADVRSLSADRNPARDMPVPPLNARPVAIPLLCSPSPALRSPHFSRWPPRACCCTHQNNLAGCISTPSSLLTHAPTPWSLPLGVYAVHALLPFLTSPTEPSPHTASRRCHRTSSNAFPPLIPLSRESA